MVECRSLRAVRRTLVGAFLAGVALFGVGAPPVSAEPDLSDWKIEHEESSHPIAATGEIRIVNLRGGVTLRAGETDLVVVSTVSQRHGDDPRTPEVRVEELPGGLAVDVDFADDPKIEERAEWLKRRVDLGVAVPEGVTVSIRTADGDIEVKDLEGSADLATTSGKITFKGPGGIQARSDSGEVFAQLRRSNWPEPVAIETTTGEIRAELLEGANATAEIETRGPITTDFTVVIERKPGSMLKRGVATIGGGGQELRLTSYSGPIRLSAAIVPEGTKSD